MANVKNIEIVLNKEIARQAYADGVKSSIEDDTEDSIINESFEDWWSELQIALAERSNENSGLHIACVSNNEVSVCHHTRQTYDPTPDKNRCMDCGELV